MVLGVFSHILPDLENEMVGSAPSPKNLALLYIDEHASNVYKSIAQKMDPEDTPEQTALYQSDTLQFLSCVIRVVSRFPYAEAYLNRWRSLYDRQISGDKYVDYGEYVLH